MRIKIINPNTTTTFTELSLNAGRAVAAPGTEILAGQPSSGTPSVECHVDEAVATLGVIQAVQAGAADRVDGYVIACFGDTGLDAAREAARAIEEDHAEAISLGCAGLEPLLGPFVETLGVPVIEGVASVVKMVDAL